MDLIEVLWKQDVDLGFSIEQAKAEKPELDADADASSPSTNDKDEVHEKLKTLKAINEGTIKVCTNYLKSDRWLTRDFFSGGAQT